MLSTQEGKDQSYLFQFTQVPSCYISEKESCLITECELGELIETSDYYAVPCIVAAVWQDCLYDTPPHIFDAEMLLKHFISKNGLENPRTKKTAHKVQLLWNKPKKNSFTTFLSLDTWPKVEIIKKIALNMAIACGSNASFEDRLSCIMHVITASLIAKNVSVASSWIEVLSTIIKNTLNEEIEYECTTSQEPTTAFIPYQIGSKLIHLYLRHEGEFPKESAYLFQEIISLCIASMHSTYQDDLYAVYPFTTDSLIQLSKNIFNRLYNKRVHTENIDTQNEGWILLHIKHILHHAHALSPENIQIVELIADTNRFSYGYINHIEAVHLYKEVLRNQPNNMRVKVALAALLYESSFLHEYIDTTTDVNECERRKSKERTQLAQRLLEEAYLCNPMDEYTCFLLTRILIERRLGAQYDLKRVKGMLAMWGGGRGRLHEFYNQGDSSDEAIQPFSPVLVFTPDLLINEMQSDQSSLNKHIHVDEIGKICVDIALDHHSITRTLEHIYKSLLSEELIDQFVMMINVVASLQKRSIKTQLIVNLDSWYDMLSDIIEKLRREKTILKDLQDYSLDDGDRIIINYLQKQKLPLSNLFYNYVSIRYNLPISITDSIEEKLKKAALLIKKATQYGAARFSYLLLREISYRVLELLKQTEIFGADEKKDLSYFAHLVCDPTTGLSQEAHEILINLLLEIRQYISDDKEIEFIYSKALFYSHDHEHIIHGQHNLRILVDLYPDDIAILEECAMAFASQKSGAEHNPLYAYELQKRVTHLLRKQGLS